jgi:hypothetical protein
MALTLHHKRWYSYIFLILFVAVIAAWWRFAHRPELLISVVGGVLGFAYFIYLQHLDEAKLFKELFAEFNARYDALNDDLNTILFGPSDGLFIDRGVWESWYRGMNVFFKHPRIQALWIR